MKLIPAPDELIREVRKGNERALHLLYKNYRPSLYQFINRQIRDVGTTEELVQDVFMGALDGIRENKKIESFSAYIFAIARHKIIDYIRKKKIKKMLLSAIPEHFFNSCATLLFNDITEKKELEDSVERILKDIPHEYALIIRLKYIEGLPVQTIAKKLALNFKAVESKLFRARKLFASLYTHLNS